MDRPGSSGRFLLTEEERERLVFDTFGNPRHTQGSPLLPEVWIAYFKEVEGRVVKKIDGTFVDTDPETDGWCNLLVTPFHAHLDPDRGRPKSVSQANAPEADSRAVVGNGAHGEASEAPGVLAARLRKYLGMFLGQEFKGATPLKRRSRGRKTVEQGEPLLRIYYEKTLSLSGDALPKTSDCQVAYGWTNVACRLDVPLLLCVLLMSSNWWRAKEAEHGSSEGSTTGEADKNGMRDETGKGGGESAPTLWFEFKEQDWQPGNWSLLRANAAAKPSDAAAGPTDADGKPPRDNEARRQSPEKLSLQRVIALGGLLLEIDRIGRIARGSSDIDRGGIDAWLKVARRVGQPRPPVDPLDQLDPHVRTAPQPTLWDEDAKVVGKKLAAYSKACTKLLGTAVLPAGEYSEADPASDLDDWEAAAQAFVSGDTFHFVPPVLDFRLSKHERNALVHTVGIDREANGTSVAWSMTVKADAAGQLFNVDGSGITWAVIDSGIDARHAGFLTAKSVAQHEEAMQAAQVRNQANKEKPNENRSDLSNVNFVLSRVRETYDFSMLQDILAINANLTRLFSYAGAKNPAKGKEAFFPGLKDAKSGPLYLMDMSSGRGQRQRIARARDLPTISERFFRWLKLPIGPESSNMTIGKYLVTDKNMRRALGHLAIRNYIGRDLDWTMVAPLIAISRETDRYIPPNSDHGTHVAGVIGANYRPEGDQPITGICPNINLIDIRVFGPDGTGDEFAVLSAIDFVERRARDGGHARIHGVNLSISLPHLVQNFACGRTPVCEAANRLAAAGVVVVAAAGNNGFDRRPGLLSSRGSGYHDISISDPGNAQHVITVGSTHAREPHAYGVSYFSGRGPTADGRMKPDLVAPGEKITSLATGGGVVTLDGTSMAAPHVSGVAALLLARYPELIGQPQRIKEILMRTATDLGRERAFQGAGLVDALRALQAV